MYEMPVKTISNFENKVVAEEAYTSPKRHDDSIFLISLDTENMNEKDKNVSEISCSSTTDYYGNVAHYRKNDYTVNFVLKSGIKKTFSLLDNKNIRFKSFVDCFDFIGENFDFNFEEFCNYYDL